MSRIEALQKPLADGQAALIITPVNRRYFTGFPSSLGYLFVSRARSVLYVDSRYLEAAEKKAVDCEVRQLIRLSSALCEFAQESGVERFLVEKEISLGEFERLKELSPYFFEAGRLSAQISELRQIKSQDEVARIVKAQRIAEAAFEQLLTIIRPGVSERELALELDYQMKKRGADDISFDTIAVSGENSSMPHGVPGERRVTAGDFITFDFGAVFDGYHSDMTRTIAVGSVSEEMRQVYETVLNAQKNCIARLTAGMRCSEGDAAARGLIDAAGYGRYFGHGTGHSVGLEIHEEPRLSPNCEDVLRSGIIMTVEPGIYLPGKFGVRIEDMVLITEGGCTNLTQFPKELTIL